MGKITLLKSWDTTETFASYTATDKVNINAEKTTKTFTTVGADQLEVQVQFQDVGAATATDITIGVDESEDGTNWSKGQTGSAAAGVITLSDRSWVYATPVDGDIIKVLVPITASYCRVRVIGTGGTVDQDRASVRVKALHTGS